MTSSQKKRLRRAILGLAGLVAVAAGWKHIPALQSLEQLTLDLRYKSFNRANKASDQVKVIEIDEGSMKVLEANYGRWPWPRRVYKELIEFFAVGEPKVILFDLMFTERTLGTEDDRILAETSRSVGIVSHAMNLLVDRATEGSGAVSLPEDLAAIHQLTWKGDPDERLVPEKPYQDFLVPLPEWTATLPLIHSVNAEKDEDGVFRHMTPVFPYEKAWFPSLAIKAITKLTGANPMLSRAGQELLVQGADKTYTLPLDERGRSTIHYYRNDRKPEMIPFASVIESALALQKGDVSDPAQLPVNPLNFKDKIILIGASAAGLEDLKATPVDPAYPGVLLHATTISNILQKDFLKSPPTWLPLAATLALLIVAYVSVFFMGSLVARVGVPFVAFGAYSYLSLYLFESQSFALPLAMPVGLGLVGLFDGLAYLSFIEGRERKRLAGTLSKYLSPAVTDQMLNEGIDPQAEVGSKKELSVLFSDIRGFTTMSEKLAPEVLVAHLNEYLGRMTNVIFHEQGTLDKFIGDAIMAFWGAPLPDEHHALRAVRTGLKMQEELKHLRQEWTSRGKLDVAIEVGVGVNTGDVIVGNIGSDKRLDYTVIGDNVNLASRGEGLTKQYHVNFLIGERTEELVRSEYISRPIDLVRVKGKLNPVRIYEPLCSKTDNNVGFYLELQSRFQEGWRLYEQGEFLKAYNVFHDLNLWRPGGDGPSQVYMERCSELMKTPPVSTEWDGVYVAKAK